MLFSFSRALVCSDVWPCMPAWLMAQARTWSLQRSPCVYWIIQRDPEIPLDENPGSSQIQWHRLLSLTLPEPWRLSLTALLRKVTTPRQTFLRKVTSPRQTFLRYKSRTIWVCWLFLSPVSEIPGWGGGLGAQAADLPDSDRTSGFRGSRRGREADEASMQNMLRCARLWLRI